MGERARSSHGVESRHWIGDRNVVKNLFVGNLGSEVTHEELRRLFEAYGQVVQVHITVDRDTGLPRESEERGCVLAQREMEKGQRGNDVLESSRSPRASVTPESENLLPARL
jgi:hypothetical protein